MSDVGLTEILPSCQINRYRYDMGCVGAIPIPTVSIPTLPEGEG